MKKILLAEDEENFGALLKNYLELSKYEVVWAQNGAEAYSQFMKTDFDLCIFDVMMPHMDGFTLGEKIQKKKKVPFLYLTAKGKKEDILKGYSIGADDYLTKPFDTEVLLKKINVILNRSDNAQLIPAEKETYQLGKFKFLPKNRLLVYEESTKNRLSPKESLLLELLCRFEGKIMPRETALNQIWNENSYFTKRSMDVYITKLRKHLSPDPKISIETFNQLGFQLNVNQ